MDLLVEEGNGASVLAPGQAEQAPAALAAAMALLVGVALEAFQDVVRLDAQLGGAPGGRRSSATPLRQSSTAFLPGGTAAFRPLS
jgi:hypothetical protein